MSRDTESYKAELFRRLPRGPIWPVIGDEATVWDALFDVLAEEFSRVRADADAWLADFFPDGCTQQLPEWERLLGLPDCGIALGSVAERRSAIVARLRRRGDPTLANIQALADSFDNGAVVSAGGTSLVFVVNINVVGDALGADSATSTVYVSYDAPQSDVFECTMRHAIPLHNTIEFEVNP